MKTSKVSMAVGPVGRIVVAACGLVGSFFLGCEKDRLADGLPPEINCSTCHGSPENPAPPVSLSGSKDTTDPGVGAHKSHVREGAISRKIECTECHLVPESVDADGHVDDALPAEITWGELATTEGLDPVWDRENERCSSTYCHGASLSGGSNTEPKWTVVDGTQKACGTCHGNPPPYPHPDRRYCHTCHGETVTANGTIDVAGGHHLDGELDSLSACNTCHGNEDSPAPPVSVSGSSDTSDTEVGAHQSHLSDGLVRQAVACDECHVVPAASDAEGHLDDSPAEVVWGTLATAQDQAPRWNRNDNRCASVYCHGSSLSGGSNTAPVWTVVDGTQATCGTCHGNPPAGPHPIYTDCDRCHPDTVDESGQIILASGRHIDGILDSVVLACNACHGGPDSSAPPVDTRGNSATTERGVGAHREHLGPSDWHAEIGCDECHLVPSLLQDPGHADTPLPAELTWGALATADDSQPGFDQATATCSGVYCHGATLKGTGSNRSPNWTNVGASEAACGTCHQTPPESGGHPQIDDCSLCHECVAEDAQTIRTDGAYLHINGENNLEPLGSCPPP